MRPVPWAPMSSGAIGVFDSGLGGLTVLRALIDLLPDEDVLYFGDTARFPYGPKPHDEVLKYAIEIGDRLVDEGVKMLVVACNSAASVALETLQERYAIPVVGVVAPGVRAASKATQSRRVGIIATVGTVASGSYQRAVERFAPDLDITCAACPGFVEFVESGEVDSDQVRVLAERLLAPVRDADIDTLVLGCTHYPLLARTITDVMGPDVVLVSSADETAFEILAMIRDDVIAPAAPSRRAQHRFVTSGDATTFAELGARFLGPEVVRVETWPWPG
jgi:glutamate racemase